MQKEFTISRVVNSMIWVTLVVGLVVGSGSTVLTMKMIKKPVETEQVAKDQIKLQIQLTDLDLVKPLCTPKFIAENEDHSLICRELFCRMQTRGIDSKTAGADCESIGNMLNKNALYRFCQKVSKGDKDIMRSCIELYDRRI